MGHDAPSSASGANDSFGVLNDTWSYDFATVASSPSGVIATSADASASLSWTGPSGDGGAAVTGYTVSATDTTTSTTTSDACPGADTSTTTTCTVAGLTNGDSYSFTVAAINVVGTGPFSLASNVVTPSAPPAPISPQNALTLTTTSASYDGTAYSLDLATSGGSGPGGVTYSVTDGTATNCVVSGATLTASSAGTCVVTAMKYGSPGYQAITAPATPVTFSQATPMPLSLTTTNAVVGRALVLATSGGSGSGAVSFTVTSSGAANCSLSRRRTLERDSRRYLCGDGDPGGRHRLRVGQFGTDDRDRFVAARAGTRTNRLSLERDDVDWVSAQRTQRPRPTSSRKRHDHDQCARSARPTARRDDQELLVASDRGARESSRDL